MRKLFLSGLSVSLLALPACSPSGEVTEEALGERHMAIVPAEEGAFAYLRGNTTGWSADGNSAMQQVAPGVWEKTFEVAAGWEVNQGTSFVLTFTNEEAGWGSQSATYSDPAHLQSPYTELGQTSSLALSDAPFIVRVSEPGIYKLSLFTSPGGDPEYTVTGGEAPAAVDECAEGLAACDPGASCIDLEQGYFCECQYGLIGDGKTCVSPESLYADHCSAAGIAEGAFEPITLGQDYDWWRGESYHTQMTVEDVDFSQEQGKLVKIITRTSSYPIEFSVYPEGFDRTRAWWDSGPVLATTSRVADACLSLEIPVGTEHSIGYITRPVEDSVPDGVTIERAIVVSEPSLRNDYSDTVVFDFASLPDDMIAFYDDPAAFSANLNAAYDAMADYVGEQSHVLDDSGHMKLTVVEDSWACGLAGNPVVINSRCLKIADANLGSVGWVPIHEMGHNFTTHRSFIWNGDSSEMWASFVGYRAYASGAIPNLSGEGRTMNYEYWVDTLKQWPNQANDLFIYLLDLEIEYGDTILKTFFRKYAVSDPALGGTEDEKKALLVQRLAESAREVSGDPASYDATILGLEALGFPRP